MEPGLKRAPKILKELRDFLETGHGREDEWLFVAWHVPVQPAASVWYGFKRTMSKGVDLVFDRLWDRFTHGTDKFRNERFKFIPSVKQVRAITIFFYYSIYPAQASIEIVEFLILFKLQGPVIFMNVDLGAGNPVSTINYLFGDA